MKTRFHEKGSLVNYNELAPTKDISIHGKKEIGRKVKGMDTDLYCTSNPVTINQQERQINFNDSKREHEPRWRYCA